MSKNNGMITVAVVAIAAIIGLVMNFSGGSVGAFDVEPQPVYPVQTNAYVPLVGYSQTTGIETSPAILQVGTEIGNQCLGWTVDKRECCSLTCGDPSVCPDGNCFGACYSACVDVIDAYYGY